MESTYTIKVGEARLEAVVSGAGDTVILLPAGSHHIGYLAPCAQHLAKAGFRAVAVNFRGVGASTGPLEGLTLHHLAADIAGLIETLAAAPAHLPQGRSSQSVGNQFHVEAKNLPEAVQPDRIIRYCME